MLRLRGPTYGEVIQRLVCGADNAVTKVQLFPSLPINAGLVLAASISAFQAEGAGSNPVSCSRPPRLCPQQ